MIAAVVNSLWTPMTISFEYVVTLAQDSTQLMFWVDIAANLIFFFDIIINFFVSYIDTRTGIEV